MGIFGEGIATVKYDGSATMWKDGIFYKRYDAKKGKTIPENAIKCQENPDPITGHFPCWIPVNTADSSNKWYVEALKNYISAGNIMENRSYEAIGKHFNQNSYHMDFDTLVPHGADIVQVERTVKGLKKYLEEEYIEGLVFWKDGEPKCKIRRKDFGYQWN